MVIDICCCRFEKGQIFKCSDLQCFSKALLDYGTQKTRRVSTASKRICVSKKMIACSLKKGNDPPSAFPPAPLLGSFRQMPAVAHLTQFLLSGNRNAWIMEPMPTWVSLVSRVGLEKIISRYLRKQPWLEFKNSRMNWVARLPPKPIVVGSVPSTAKYFCSRTSLA